MENTEQKLKTAVELLVHAQKVLQENLDYLVTDPDHEIGQLDSDISEFLEKEILIWVAGMKHA